jgi:undecaprenyl-diphosphatase
MLFFALAFGMAFVTKRAGLILMIHAALVVCLPRIYLGLHYPSDIIVGALIGIGTVAIVMLPAIRMPLTRPFLAWCDKSPGTFYAAMFVMSVELASMLQGPRALIEMLHGLKH